MADILSAFQPGSAAPNGSLQESVSRFVRRLVPTRQLPAALLLLAGKRSRLLHAHGYGRSLKQMLPLDESGDAIPWMPYCVISLLKERLEPRMSVLEFGCGYSTLFFMKRVARVVSIEHDRSWAEQLARQVTPNVDLRITAAHPPAAYCAAVTAGDTMFDLAIIDGRHRVESFRSALPCLAPKGVIILDDSDRPDYRSALKLGADKGFKLLHLEGHKPGSIGLHRSTVFYRADNSLGL